MRKAGRLQSFCFLIVGFIPWAGAEESVPSSGATSACFVDSSLPLYQMSDLQKSVIAQLKFFDRTYQLWVNEDKSVASVWNCLAEEIFGEYASMSCEGDAQSDAPFVLRGMLASGVSSLYEAQALMEQGPHFLNQALVAYERGLETLEKVIRIAKENPAINYLPNYTTALRTNANKDTYFMHPLAGYENVLVGVDKLPVDSLFTRNLITNTSRETLLTWDLVTGETAQKSLVYPFIPLAEYQEYCRGWYETFTLKGLANEEDNSWSMHVPTRDEIQNSFFKQGSTEATARFFLSEFCPWGLGVYLTLRDAGLTRGLDWRILRPFAGEQPQDMCELSITKPFLIPNHILGEFAQIVGNGTAGFLDLEKEIPVQWAWVGQPTYTLKYISPLVYKRVRSDDRFSQAMGCVKFVFGPLNWGVDRLSEELIEMVGHYYGADNEVYCVSWALFNANDMGVITSDFVDIGKILKTNAKFYFEHKEEEWIKKMFEGIDPRSVSLGIGYAGQPIPSIMIRGDVIGFQKVPVVEYGRTIQSVRNYVLRPSAIVHKAPGLPYDLSKNEGLGDLRKGTYLKEQWANNPRKPEVIRKRAWEKLSPPFGAPDYINDFSPAFQVFNILLPKKEFEQWTKNRPLGLPEERLLYVQLWQESLGENNRLLINERINDPSIQLIVYNTHSPEGYNAYQGRDKAEGILRGMKGAQGAPEAFRYFGRSDCRGLPVADLALDLTNRLQTRYRLIITQGKEGRELAEYPLVIFAGRGKERARVTGTLSWYEGGGVALKASLSKMGFNLLPPISWSEN